MQDSKSQVNVGQPIPDPANIGYSVNHRIRLVRAGHEYFDLLEQLIHEARYTIHVQAYIFDNDDTGKFIGKALMDAAKRKVKVFLVVHGYASQELPDNFIRNLKESGVHFRFFGSFLKSKYFYFGRRLHHKVVVVDGYRSLVGGINIGNHYNDTPENIAWLDWALYTEGKIGRELQHICEARVKRSLVRSLNRTVIPPVHHPGSSNEGYWVRPRINDWVRRKRQITSSYLQMLSDARSHVIIISSYFLPGKIQRKYLSAAAKRGVTVKVIVAGISDVTLAKHAERYMYRWLLRNKIEIYEYQRKVLHAKLATYDGKWVTIGSYNVNNISAYASVELNLDVWDKRFAQDVEHQLNEIITNHCIRITDEMHRENQNLWNRYIQRSAYDIFRFLLFIFTFYFKQRD